MGKIKAKSIFRLVPLICDLGRFLQAFTLKLPIDKQGLGLSTVVVSFAADFWMSRNVLGGTLRGIQKSAAKETTEVVTIKILLPWRV